MCLQVYGSGNITAVNATANRVIGPVYIVVKVRDGVTNQECEYGRELHSFRCLTHGGCSAAAAGIK